MPVINIQELNATSATPLGNTDGLPVAIIGCATNGPITPGTTDDTTVFTPTLCRSLTQFKRIFGSSAPASRPYGYYAAVECLMNGNAVLFTRIGQAASTGALAKATLATSSITKIGRAHV